MPRPVAKRSRRPIISTTNLPVTVVSSRRICAWLHRGPHGARLAENDYAIPNSRAVTAPLMPERAPAELSGERLRQPQQPHHKIRSSSRRKAAEHRPSGARTTVPPHLARAWRSARGEGDSHRIWRAGADSVRPSPPRPEMPKSEQHGRRYGGEQVREGFAFTDFAGHNVDISSQP